MPDFLQGTRPTLTFLSTSDREQIHAAALHVLEEVGMQVEHEHARELLLEAGCLGGGEDGAIRIPGELLDRCLQSVPRAIQVYDRLGQPAMDLGGRRVHFGTGSDLLFAQEPGQAARHRAVMDDVRRAARVADALPNIDFVMTMATPSEVPPAHAYLLSVRELMQTSRKPVVCTADNRADLEAIWDVAAILRGGEERLAAEPYVIHYAEPVSPLKHPFTSVDKLLFCAEKGLPAIYSPAPIAGSTAPMTMAGHIAQGLAECFTGLVIHQLHAEGSPFLMGMGPAVLDMATVECSYNAPEYYLSYVGIIEMSHHYDLPSWGYAGHSDASVPDGQAALEAGQITLLAQLAGANLCHDEGYMDFGRMQSLEQIVLGDELISQARRLCRGIPVDEQTLALDVIEEAGRSGNYLGHKHTRKNMRTTQWRPKLMSRLGYNAWHDAGEPDLRTRTLARLDKLLATHEPEPVPEDLLAQIEARVARYCEENPTDS